MTIYLIRHGQTEYNREGRFQGQLDSDLTELGRTQAARAGRCLAGLIGEHPCMMIASPLGRTRDTARIAAAQLAKPPKVETDDRLKEVSLGQWDGELRSRIDAQWPGFPDRHPAGEWYFHAPDGERLAPFRARLAEALQDAAGHAIRPVILVSHGVAGRMLRGLHADLRDEDALTAEVPQDALFALHPGGGIERISYPD